MSSSEATPRPTYSEEDESSSTPSQSSPPSEPTRSTSEEPEEQSISTSSPSSSSTFTSNTSSTTSISSSSSSSSTSPPSPSLSPPTPTRRQEPGEGEEDDDGENSESTTEPPSTTADPTTSTEEEEDPGSTSTTLDTSTSDASTTSVPETSTTDLPDSSTALSYSTSDITSTTPSTTTTLSTTTSNEPTSTSLSTTSVSTSTSAGPETTTSRLTLSTSLDTSGLSSSLTSYPTAVTFSTSRSLVTAEYPATEATGTGYASVGSSVASYDNSAAAQPSTTGGVAGLGTAVSQIGNGIASTDDAIRVVSPSEVASSGIGQLPVGTETDTDGAAATAPGRNPFLNNGGSSSAQSGKLIGGIVGGIVSAIVIVIAAIWLLGKRRRKKFVKPMVERIHTSGSAYSLPGMLAGGGGKNGGGWNGLGAAGVLGYNGHNRRRSRAFSIESASDYDPVEFADNSEHGSPSRAHGNSQSYFAAPGPATQPYGNVHGYKAPPNEEETLMLPPGAAPYHPAAYAYGQVPSGTTHRSQPSESSHHTHASSPSGHSMYHSQSSSGAYNRAEAPNSASTHATSFQQAASKVDHRSSLAPLEADIDPLPNSPTLQPSQLAPGTLKRRTTDPFFGNKTTLRVVNPDAERASLKSPTLGYLQPPQEYGGPRDSRYSVASDVSDFHYDSYPASPVPVLGRQQGKDHRPAYLDLNGTSAQSLKRGDSPSVYTPNEVNDVKFFRDDDTI